MIEGAAGTYETDTWLVEYRRTRVEGRNVISSICIHAVGAVPEEGITAVDLRELLSKIKRRPAEPSGAQTKALKAAAKAIEKEMAPRQGAATPPEFLQAVATGYIVATSCAPRRSVLWLTEQLRGEGVDVQRSDVARWVQICRDRGFLTPAAKRRRPGAEAGEAFGTAIKPKFTPMYPEPTLADLKGIALEPDHQPSEEV